MAGGRYDGLVASLGGEDLQGVGWAGGVERLCLLAQGVEIQSSRIVLLPIEAEQRIPSLLLARDLRCQGFAIEVDPDGKLTRRLKRADRNGARVVMLLGAQEVEVGEVLLRDMTNGAQRNLPLAACAEALEAMGIYPGAKSFAESLRELDGSIGQKHQKYH